MAVVNILVEGSVDEAVAIRIIEYAEHTVGMTFPKRGWAYIRDNVHRYNGSARIEPCLTLIDFMDTGASCPPEVVSNMLVDRHPNMVFRVVVREIESWLLADYKNIAKFLHIRTEFITTTPENLVDPKRELVNLARKSTNRKIREAMVPSHGSTAREGSLYVSELIRFIETEWDIEAACAASQSLKRCITRLQELQIV